MKRYKVNKLPVADLVSSLAEQMKTDFSARFGEHIVTLPTFVGEGYIRGLNFPNGVGLLEYNCTFNEETSIDFESQQIHPLKFIYCVEGKLCHRTSNQTKEHELDPLRHVIVGSSSNEGHHFRFQPKIKTRICSVEIDRLKYQRQIDFDLKDVNFEFYKILADVNAVNSVYHSGHYGLKIADIIKELDNFKETELIRTNFLGAKSLEIFSYMLMQYADDLNIIENKTIIRASEIKAIEDAVHHIQTNLGELGTIDEIGRFVGLNSQKLQEGFKILYNTTVHKFIQEKRLEYAVNLLRTEEHNITEIASIIGFSSRSHFAKIFKEKYGVNPKGYPPNKPND